MGVIKEGNWVSKEDKLGNEGLVSSFIFVFSWFEDYQKFWSIFILSDIETQTLDSILLMPIYTESIDFIHFI